MSRNEINALHIEQLQLETQLTELKRSKKDWETFREIYGLIPKDVKDKVAHASHVIREKREEIKEFEDRYKAKGVRIAALTAAEGKAPAAVSQRK